MSANPLEQALAEWDDQLDIGLKATALAAIRVLLQGHGKCLCVDDDHEGCPVLTEAAEALRGPR